MTAADRLAAIEARGRENPFVALYRSRCVTCDGDVRPGDDVTWDDDNLVHLDCHEARDRVCRRCCAAVADPSDPMGYCGPCAERDGSGR